MIIEDDNWEVLSSYTKGDKTYFLLKCAPNGTDIETYHHVERVATYIVQSSTQTTKKGDTE